MRLPFPKGTLTPFRARRRFVWCHRLALPINDNIGSIVIRADRSGYPKSTNSDHAICLSVGRGDFSPFASRATLNGRAPAYPYRAGCAGRAAPYQLHTRLVVAAQWSRSAPCGRINIAEGPRLFTPTAACRSVIRSFWLYLITLWARGFSHNF